MIWIVYNTDTGVLISSSTTEPSINQDESKVEVDFIFNAGQPFYFFKYDGSDVVENDEGSIQESINIKINEYEIQSDVDSIISQKDIRTINYKTELGNDVCYTPEYIIHDEGINSGLLDKTNYYRDYIDESNKGVLVLVVEEIYTVDNSDTSLFNSAKPATSREKKWKYAKKGGGLDEVKFKRRNKKYNTRTKRSKEGRRRRRNIQEQLIDNVGMAGILSGIFISENDVYEKLTLLLQYHNAAFNGWKASGKGTVYDDIESDNVSSWLSLTVCNSVNQPDITRNEIAPIEYTPVAHMSDMTMKEYIIEKLKGNIK